MLAEQINEGRLSTSTVRRQVLVLGVILKAAVLDGRIARNPCASVKLPQDVSRPMRFLTAEEIVRVADASGYHVRPMILTAGFIGLRFSELAGLRTDKINVLARSIRIDVQLLEVDGKLSFRPPKTRAGIRTVSMPATLADFLSDHLGTDPVARSGMCFPSPNGGLLRRSNFRHVWRRACTAAGFDDGPLDGLLFHELRHTAVALAVHEDAHPLAIKERLGHASIQTTMDTYGGLFPSLDEAIAKGLDQTFIGVLAASSRPETASIVHLARSGGVDR
jgi:integrase